MASLAFQSILMLDFNLMLLLLFPLFCRFKFERSVQSLLGSGYLNAA
jgi:hypothetical protein